MNNKVLMLLLGLSVMSATRAQDKRLLDSLTNVYEANGYHGVIRIAKGDQLIYEKAYGFANLEKKLLHTPSTLFKTESVGKMFTAVSIFQLIEQGKLSLDQNLKELLPDTRIKNSDKITLHHLLNHTSGLQSPWDHPQWQFKKAYTRSELRKIIEEVPLAFDSVGKEMYYSNSGYILLSFIVEKVSGLPFDEYYRQHIFLPLAMKDTRHLKDTVMPENTGAQPYRILSSIKYVRMEETVGPFASGAGGWISTAKDLQIFMSALHNGKLVKSSSLRTMVTANQTAPKDSVYRFYAYGLETYHNFLVPGTDIYGHNGGGAGFSVDAFADATSGYIITSCTNQYMNSRPIIENYFRLVLHQSLKPVTRPSFVRFYDWVEAKGIDSVLQSHQQVFKDLNIQLHPGFVVQMAEAFLAAKDFSTWEKWMQWAQTIFAGEAFLKVIYGDGYLATGKKEEARKMYEAAKAQAIEKNDQRAAKYAGEKLKAL
ncbi:MAG TPA: serine hydrolase domain-containing protein [Chitinophagaceae bacterium]|nr:serine hydrolase domain-containing protein [Chitinophagaceae bacterium]